MAKSRSFSIFLLKQGYNAESSLKSDHVAGEKVIDATALPEGATLYVYDKHPQPPWWKDYWGITQELSQSMKGAIVFLPVRNRCVAITFGHAFHNLDDNAYEYDFGIRTTLNALDPEKIKSTDLFQPKNARRDRIQVPRASDLTFFDFSQDESIVKKLTGAAKDEYKSLLTTITGSSSLKVSSKVSADGMLGFCEQLLDIYDKEDFKNNFPGIQNITPVKDPEILEQLNASLLSAIKNEDDSLVLTIPEIVDYDQSFQFEFSGAGRSDFIFEDVHVDYYLQYLDEKKFQEITLTSLKVHKLNILDENGYERKRFSIFKSLIFDCEHVSKHYHFCEGEWYHVEKDYIEMLRISLDPCFGDHKLLKECNLKLEAEFSSSVKCIEMPVLCLDKKNIAPPKQTPVEPCDIVWTEGGKANLVHVKISTRSSTLSHLFNQGVNSLRLLHLNNESREKFKKLTSELAIANLIDEMKYSVIFGIITPKDRSNKSNNLPLFSRISLFHAINNLKLMKVPYSVVFIKDNVDRSKKQK